MNKIVMATLSVALAFTSQAVTECGAASVHEDEYVEDMWLPGSYPVNVPDAGTTVDPRSRTWYCFDKKDWLLKIRKSPSGTKVSRCVDPEVGQRQKKGALFNP